MFKFLLKKRYGLMENRSFYSFLLFIPFFILAMCVVFFPEYLVEYKFAFLSFCFIMYYVIFSSKKWIEDYRKNTPYKIKSVNENKKELKMHIYPALDKIEFYYKGKLHRENKPAVVHNYTSKDNKKYEFHLFGKKYKNKEHFKKSRKFAHLQNQIDSF